jgi:hypothetical protein
MIQNGSGRIFKGTTVDMASEEKITGKDFLERIAYHHLAHEAERTGI